MNVDVSASMCCSWEAVRMRVEKESMNPDLLWLGLPKSMACRQAVGNSPPCHDMRKPAPPEGAGQENQGDGGAIRQRQDVRARVRHHQRVLDLGRTPEVLRYDSSSVYPHVFHVGPQRHTP